MVRWRYFIVVALLLLLPVKTVSEDDDEEEHAADETEEEEEEEDDEEEDDVEKSHAPVAGRRTMGHPTVYKPTTPAVTGTFTRPEKKRPLECYVCAYKSETPMRSCLDPTKYRVHTLTCHGVEDKCFTSIISKQGNYEAVVRGCRSNCVGTPDTTCCEINRCNNQALAMPTPAPKALVSENSQKSLQPNVLFFVTILLLLQTVVRVVIV